MAYLLCENCKKRHSKNRLAKLSKSPAECYICQGKLELLPKLCDEAFDLAKKAEWNSFIVQTTFERKLLFREEELFDSEQIEESMAIKNQANQIAIAYLAKKSKKQADSNGDIALSIDFSKNEGRATPSNLYISGHYIKKSREYCQHDWACMACRGKGCKQCNYTKEKFPSIENAFRKVFTPAFGAADTFLHASGREDVDVLSLEGGRPFVLEIIHPLRRHADLGALSKQLAENFPLEAKGLKYCQKFWIEAICTSHFDKHYRAIVEGERQLDKEDWKKLSSSFPIHIKQQTPIRVLRRRTDLIRKRTVYNMKLVSNENGKLIVDIWAEAGTYIKELIHSDGGRTNPSFSSILGMQCKCTQLDVMGIDDAFINSLRARA